MSLKLIVLSDLHSGTPVLADSSTVPLNTSPNWPFPSLSSCTMHWRLISRGTVLVRIDPELCISCVDVNRQREIQKLLRQVRLQSRRAFELACDVRK